MPLTLPAASVALLLKQQTLAAHQEAEEFITHRLNQLRNREDYARLLHLFYGYYFPLEEIIAQVLGHQTRHELGERRMSPWILADLQSLGLPIEDIALCNRLPHITTEAEALGALYVMQGSSLGGRMICQMLLRHPVLRLERQQLNFFIGYGEETGLKWKTFVQVINAHSPDADEIIAAARSTFLHFSNWIYNRPHAKH